MNLLGTGLIVKITSSLFFLISGIIWKKLLLSKINYHVIFYRTLASILFVFIFICIVSQVSDNPLPIPKLDNNSIMDWLFMLFICFFSFWGLYFYSNAIKSGRYSFVTSLTGISALFSFSTSVLLYNESLTILKGVALLLIVCGLLWHQKDKIVSLTISKEILLIVLSGIFWGTSFVLYLIPIQKFGIINFSFVLEWCVLVSSIFLIIVKDKKIFPPKFDKKSLYLSVLMGFMVSAGSVLNNFSLTQLPVSVNIILSLLFEIVVLLVGIYLFKERLNSNDRILILLITVGGFFLITQ